MIDLKEAESTPSMERRPSFTEAPGHQVRECSVGYLAVGDPIPILNSMLHSQMFYKHPLLHLQHEYLL